MVVELLWLEAMLIAELVVPCIQGIFNEFDVLLSDGGSEDGVFRRSVRQGEVEDGCQSRVR